MKKIIWVFVFLIVISCANAATKSYSLTQVLENEIDTGTYQLGSIIFNPIITTPIIYSTDNNFSTLSVTKHDVIKNGISSSIIIDSTILVPGATMEMLNIGNVIYYEVANQNNIGTIQVVDLPIEQISFINRGNIPLLFSESNFGIDTEKVIAVKTQTDLQLASGPYQVKFDINSNIGNVTQIIKNVDVRSKVIWNITDNSYTPLVNVGAADSFGHFTLLNTGNDIATIKINRSGDLANFIYTSNQMILYPNIPNDIELYYDIDVSAGVGNKTINFSFDDGNQIEKFGYVIQIKDNIFPYFKEYDIGNVSIKSDTIFTFLPIDNQKIVNISGQIIHKSSKRETSLSFEKQSDGRYISKIEILDVGNHNITVCINDESLNENCTAKDFSVDELDIIIMDKKINFGKSKIKTYKQKEFYFVPISMDIEFELVKMTHNESFTIKITNGDEEDFFEQVGDIIVMNTNGTVSIAINGGSTDNYRGEINVVTPDYHKPIGRISFSGEFVDYNVPESFKGDWYGGDIDCDAHDTGEPDTSSYVCKIVYPIGKNFEDLAIPITQEQKEKQEQLINDTLEKWKGKNSNKFWFIFFETFFGCTLMMVLCYHMFISPRWRFRIK